MTWKRREVVGPYIGVNVLRRGTTPVQHRHVGRTPPAGAVLRHPGRSLALAIDAGLSRLGEGVIDGPRADQEVHPVLALTPLRTLWFGIGESMKPITIALGVFVPVYIHSHNGLRTMDAAGPNSPRR
ncbi:hypothetical protein ACFQ7F_29420 [Streptomyces sp. NPDC056486]|uniref:hypothetical protein n=1 Tax=Streptomyces sp. NPDC056486 TaxID=3345835 RepID=UPI0036CC5F68